MKYATGGDGEGVKALSYMTAASKADQSLLGFIKCCSCSCAYCRVGQQGPNIIFKGVLVLLQYILTTTICCYRSVMIKITQLSEITPLLYNS